MKKIQILGPGCTNCTKLAEAAESAARELGIPYELEKITEIDRIINFGIMMTPALVIDGEVTACGRVPSTAEIKNLLGA